MEKVSKDLKNLAIKVINYEKKEMMPLRNYKKRFYKNEKFVIYVKRNLVQIKTMKKNLN